ncbi:MAG: hypothetical protein CR997_12595 [Acidobacteria bacterium]|nr:MAG: hypothetical protein CR997_12595 [Acidobacteriota bacterium]
MFSKKLTTFFLFSLATCVAMGQIVADHFSTDLSLIQESAVHDAKAQLRIWYGHTSHGGQITSGMSVLANDYPTLYNYNSSGSGGALSYQERSDDLGHNGDDGWEIATREQLDRPDNDRNVVVWSWCGGVSDNTVEGINTYLNLMNQLELDYPDVTFIYMTGHLDGTGEEGNLHERNNQIRQYCQTNNKILYDFADIESYDPDGNYFLDLNADDACNYELNGETLNWAVQWCDANPGVCSSVHCAHSHSLNCDRKGVAFWWLLTQLVSEPPCIDAPVNVSAEVQAATQNIQVSWSHPGTVDQFYIQRRVNSGSWNLNYATVSGSNNSFVDSNLSDGTYAYRVVAHLNDDGTGTPCDSPPSAMVSAVIATQPPASPTRLSGAYQSDGVHLSWSDESDNEQGFHIEKSVDGASFEQAGQVSQNVSSWIDSAVTPLTSVAYRVYAYNQNGDSGYSNTVTVEIPEETLFITLQDTDEVDDSFLDPTDPDTAFGSSPYVNEIAHFIIKFNLPETMNHKTIIDAKIAFYGWNQQNWQPDQTMELYPVSRSWQEPTVTWERACTCAAWTTPGGDYLSDELVGLVEITENCDHCFYPEVDVTEIVQDWIDGCRDNFGFMLINNSLTATSLKASEYNNDQRTYLTIEYSNQPHINDTLFGEIAACWCLDYNSHYDLDGNGIINIIDLLNVEEGCAP